MNTIIHIIEQLKSNLWMLKIIHILILEKKLMIKIQNLELVIKNIFAKGYIPNWSEEVFISSKIKIQFHGHM